jgi:photosystem II stability/assembly factor-like uncharacterized protein
MRRWQFLAAAMSLACSGGPSSNRESVAPPAGNPTDPGPTSSPSVERIRFQSLPPRVFVGQQFDVAVVLEDRSGQPVSARTDVSISVTPQELSSSLTGTFQATSEAGIARFRLKLAAGAPHVVLRATLATGVFGDSDPFDVVVAPQAPQADGPWAPAGPGGAPVNLVAVAPDDSSVLYAATNRGLFRSRDGAASWTLASAAGVENPAFRELAVESSSRIYASSDGVYVSYDGGDSFTAIEAGLPRSEYGNYAFIFGLARHPATGDLWGWNAGLRRFDPRTQRWNMVAGGESVRSFWLAPSDPNTLYGTSDQGFLVSHDAGATWTLRTSLKSGWMVDSLAVNPADASLLVAAKPLEGLIRSADGGLAWTTITADESGSVGSVWFATRDRAYLARIGPRFERSDDGGKTWTAIAVPGDGLCKLAFDPRDGDVVFAGCSRYLAGTGVYKSNDGGATWSHASDGMHAAAIGALGADHRSGAAFVGTDSGLYRTTDRGATFERVSDGPALVVESPDGTLYAGAASGLRRSTDSGVNWEMVRSQPSRLVGVHPGDPRIILVVENGGRLLRSTDRGATWTEVLCRCEIGTFATFTSLVFEGDVVYAAAQREYKGGGGLFRSADAGATWKGIDPRTFTSLVSDSGALVASVEGTVARSADGGQTWTALYTGKRYILRTVIGPSGTLWAGATAHCSSGTSVACPKSGGGVLSSNDGGETWSEPHASIEGLSVRDLLLDPRDPNTLYLGSDEAGLWITHSSGR